MRVFCLIPQKQMHKQNHKERAYVCNLCGRNQGAEEGR